jgi:hypothetical protein
LQVSGPPTEQIHNSFNNKVLEALSKICGQKKSQKLALPGPAERPRRLAKYGWGERKSEVGESIFFRLATNKEFGYFLLIEFSFPLLENPV